MNRKKSSSESMWVRREIQALRADEVNSDAIDRTVNQVLAFTPATVRPVSRPSYAWKLVPLAAGVGAGAILLFASTQRASAATLREIADAVRQHSSRHSLTYRPGEDGILNLTNEDWIDGARHRSTFVGPDGVTTVSGYDGKRMFTYSSKYGGFIDDVEPSGMPVESIDSYLQIPGGRMTKQVRRGSQDVYTIDFSNVRFELYVNPSNRLPVRRDVLTRRGDLIERNVYEYPAHFAQDTFAPPGNVGLTNYPAIRQELARRMTQPGPTKEVGGVKITLRAVIVGQSRLLALWTGGAKGEPVAGPHMWIEEMPKPLAGESVQAFTVPSKGTAVPVASVAIGGEQLRGDSAWYPALNLSQPFTINIPAWTEDRTRPIAGAKGASLGYHSKLAGRISFRVTDPIVVPDPDRLVWKPVSKDLAATAAGSDNPKP